MSPGMNPATRPAMRVELPDRARVRAEHPFEVLHVTRSFFAEPTLSQHVGQHIGGRVVVRELPLPEAVVRLGAPDLVWVSSGEPEDVDLLRIAFPHADLLVSVARDVTPTAVIDLYDRGADLVVTDEGVRHAAAAVTSLLRRRSQFTGNVQAGGSA
jgi:hypothetical protein